MPKAGSPSSHATWTLPRASEGVHRTLYLFRGDEVRIAGEAVRPATGVQVRAEVDVVISNGNAECELLVLQGRPIGEPVAQQGPFVMNTSEEIREAFEDYRRTGFGGWPWKGDAPAHDRKTGRFAQYEDGRIEKKS